MTIINALILGIVEGITEFLPISSTAHLIISSKLLNIPQTDFVKFFEVFVQAGAILAVVIIYYRYLINNKDIFKKLLFSFIPTSIVGFLFYRRIKDIFFESYGLIIGSIFIIGVIFLIVEYLVKDKKIVLDKSIKNIDWKKATLIGLAQSLAVIPGVSRAGSVIIVMMFMGYQREEAATYSFLLAVPTILVASAYDLYKMRDVITTSSNNLLILMVGFLASFITAYIVIKWLINYLKNNTLVIFGIYRMLLAIILLI